MENTKSQDTDLDWARLFQAFMDSFEWALDVAAEFARNFPDEVAAVERVRVFMRKHVIGQTAHIRIDDVLFTFALIIGAIERDLAPATRVRRSFATPARAKRVPEQLFALTRAA